MVALALELAADSSRTAWTILPHTLGLLETLELLDRSLCKPA
jgi:hypothetical protein